MRLFCKPYSVCANCLVHFEPAVGYEARWGHLCPTHRAPVMERDRRKDMVVAWAASNWEELEKLYQADTKATQSTYHALMQQQLNAYASAAQQQGLGGLGYPFGGKQP